MDTLEDIYASVNSIIWIEPFAWDTGYHIPYPDNAAFKALRKK